MTDIQRRDFLAGAAVLGASLPTSLLWSAEARAAIGDTLTIAYNLPVPSWDPTTGTSAVNPALASIYKSVFDQYVDQGPDLKQIPGVLTEWSFNADNTGIRVRVGKGRRWADGKPITAADIVWNLRRLGDPKTGNPIQFIWGSLKNFKVDDDVITADLEPYRATILGWMSFLGAYLLPPHYYEKVGKAGFEKAPMGSGPYQLEKYSRGSFARLKRNPNYWGPKPVFETVIFKFVTDVSSRVSEIESGSSDLTLDLPHEQFDRLRSKPGLAGVVHPVSDIAMIFINDIGPMLDANVRRAAVHAIDKRAIVDRLMGGYATPIDTLLTPNYVGYNAGIKTPHDPELAKKLLAESGYSRDKPVRFKIQTTRGYKPKDYETVQAIVGMWRRVGIEAEIEVYEIAKHFQLRAQDKLAPAAYYSWGNSSADPESSTGHAMFGPSPHSVWDGKTLTGMIGKLFQERDYDKRIKGYDEANRYIAENALVLPLWQFHQPVIHKAELKFSPHVANFVLPAAMGRK